MAYTAEMPPLLHVPGGGAPGGTAPSPGAPSVVPPVSVVAVESDGVPESVVVLVSGAAPSPASLPGPAVSGFDSAGSGSLEHAVATSESATAARKTGRRRIIREALAPFVP